MWLIDFHIIKTDNICQINYTSNVKLSLIHPVALHNYMIFIDYYKPVESLPSYHCLFTANNYS